MKYKTIKTFEKISLKKYWFLKDRYLSRWEENTNKMQTKNKINTDAELLKIRLLNKKLLNNKNIMQHSLLFFETLTEIIILCKNQIEKKGKAMI